MPLIYSTIRFTVMAVIMAWITLKSGSLWPAPLLRASHNLFVQAVLDRATIDKGSAAWWTGEFGEGLAITTAIAAFIILRVSAIRDFPTIGEMAAGPPDSQAKSKS